HLASLDVVDEEMVARLAAIVELAAAVVDGAGHQPFPPLEDADRAAEARLGVVPAEMAAGVAVGVLVLRPGVEHLVGLLAGEPHLAVGADDDLGVDLTLRVDPLAPLAGQLAHADDLVHPQRFLRGVEAEQPGVVAVAGRADVDPAVLADLDSRVARCLRGRVDRGEDDVAVDRLEVLAGRPVVGRRHALPTVARLRLVVEREADESADAVALAGPEVAAAVQRPRPEAGHAQLAVDARDAAGEYSRHHAALAEGEAARHVVGPAADAEDGLKLPRLRGRGLLLDEGESLDAGLREDL